MLEREVAGDAAHLLDGVAAQPARLLLRVRRDDDLVGLELVDRVAERGHGIGLDDDAVRGDACRAQQLERLVEPPPRGGAARVVVDDVALARLVHRREHGHLHVAVLAPCSSIRSTSAFETTVSFATTRMCALASLT